MTYHGKIVAVTSRPVGAEVAESSTGAVVRVRDASMFDVSGGVLTVEGVAVPYVAADPDGVDGDTVTLANPLAVELGDRLELRPLRVQTVAMVRVWDDGEPVPALVPLPLKKRLVEGVREDPSTAETVLVDLDEGHPTVVDVVGDDGVLHLGVDGQTRLGSSQDRYSVNNADGQIVGGITAEGELVGQAGSISGDLSVGGVPLMGRLWDNSPGAPTGWLERFSAGDVATAFFDTPGPTRPAGEEWGYAKVAFTARAGRAYLISVTVGAFPTVTGGSVRTRLRYVTGSGEPSIASPLIGGTTDNTGAAAHGANLMTAISRGRLSFATDTQVKVMVSSEGLAGATPAVQRAYFEVMDMGPQGSYGGGTYTTGREATPPKTVREYTSTWAANAFQVYDETGQPVVSSDLRQWGPAGAPERDYTAIEFTGGAVLGSDTGETMTAALTGATLTKAEVFLANTSWGGHDDGTAALGKGNYPTIPPTLTSPQATVNSTKWPTGAGRWVQVPVGWFDGANRVVTLGDVDGGVNGGWFMSPTDDLPPQVRLTYTR